METSSLQDLAHRVEQLIDDHQERIEGIQHLVEGVAKDVSSMSKILTVGNGTPPLTVRMALVEKDAGDAKMQIAALRKELQDKDTANDGRKWQLVLVFGTCVFSLLTALVPHLFGR